MPTHQDSTDKSMKERAIFHKDDAGQILLKTEAQEQCRNVYTLNDIYVLPETRFPPAQKKSGLPKQALWRQAHLAQNRF